MSAPFELVTDRLRIRILARTDITEFTRYRNIESIARYQDWPMPYTRDHAHGLTDEMDALGGPTRSAWTQLAIEHAGTLVGDLAVWLDGAGSLAMVGYTLAPEHQHRGYAVEALGALVHWLFDVAGVHRVAATIDPRNLASARVLERCGFEYIGTARSAALARGEWTDDARFSLLRSGWRSWTQRPTGAPDRVSLVDVTHDRLGAVLSIDRAFSQRGLVASVGESLAEAFAPPTIDGEILRPWVRAITADDEIAGFVMLAAGTASHPDPYLWRLLVDRRHQGRGIGRRCVLEIARIHRDAGDARLRVSYVADAVGSPERFYRGLGFVPTGTFDDGETVASLDLSTLPD